MHSADQNGGHVCRGVTITEAARRLGVSERTIYRYVKNGKLKTDDVSGKIRVILPETNLPNREMSDDVSQMSEKFRQYDERFERLAALLNSLLHEQERLYLEIDRIYSLLRDTLQSNERLQQALIDLLKAKGQEAMHQQSDEPGNGRRGLPTLLGRILKHDNSNRG
ncbi:MAG TPA: helix-turn-helix domain-containing protein [Chthonomonas sp.]|uniref:helix-turn-helix domain-containing protein n=1 Tax=Chthonomonas sp. TaxID=2282153 RepID=UPI002B4AEC51|nr:helix-turn-helix domain-containing protein [Chthonomonas sp.]HLI48836.1 helix-turn-helix domain-containing protein [Chthonomonas sp.]